MSSLYGLVPPISTIDMSALDGNEKISNEDLKKIIIQLQEVIQNMTLSYNQAPEMLTTPAGLTKRYAILVGSTIAGEQPVVKKLTAQFPIGIEELEDRLEIKLLP